ncbi:hypothetical protein Tco_0598518 [Tanacetum coccineum]
MEGLHCAISNAVNSGLIHGIKLSSSNITISHLFYADDVIITTEWNSINLDNIIHILQVFYLASGLKINIHKSNIYGIGVPNDEVVDMARRTGGLNIGSLKSFNLALLQKWRWRMFSFPNALWVEVIKSLHGQEGGFDNRGYKFNGTWARIVGTSNFLHSNDIIPFNSFRFQQYMDCLINDRIVNGKWKWNWSREDIGVRNTAYLRDMLLEISQVDLNAVDDHCV